ncbi:Protein tyrosine kinase family protein [Acanthocheilonema viteae]
MRGFVLFIIILKVVVWLVLSVLKLMAKKSSKATHSEKGIKKSRAEDIPKGLEDEEYFHGLLPREDCSEILTKVGDFLVRVSQPRPTDPREVIISVRVSKEQSGQSIRHIIVKKQKLPDGQTVWIAIEAIKFTSFFELLEHYTKKGDPINPELENSVLIKAIKRQPWEFSHDDITLKEMLGSGAFGEVRSGELTINKKKTACAVKIAKLTVTETQMAFRKEKIKEMMHEARLMRHYDHDNIVRIYGVAVDREPLMIVIELIKGGCLSEDLKQRKGNISDDEKVEKMCLGAAYGLQYLHSKKCIHRDIAARNILYTKDKVAKISDFGMSREGLTYKMKTSKKVPIKWTAPETIATFVYSLKTDVYSFSITVCEVFSDGEEPYKGLTNSEVKKMVLRGQRMEIPEAPEGISTLIKHCWDQNEASRWTMTAAVKKLEKIAKQLSQQSENVAGIASNSGKDMSSSKKAASSSKKNDSLKNIPDSPIAQKSVGIITIIICQ